MVMDLYMFLIPFILSQYAGCVLFFHFRTLRKFSEDLVRVLKKCENVFQLYFRWAFSQSFKSNSVLTHYLPYHCYFESAVGCILGRSLHLRCKRLVSRLKIFPLFVPLVSDLRLND